MKLFLLSILFPVIAMAAYVPPKTVSVVISNTTTKPSQGLIVTSGSINVNLFTSSGNNYAQIRVLNNDSVTSNLATIIPNGGDLINGSASPLVLKNQEQATLTLNGTNWVSVVSAAALRSQVFTSSGSFVVPAGVTKLVVEGSGGGGGGSSRNVVAACGGSAGEGAPVQTFTYTTTPLSTLSVVIGVGGTGGAGNTSASGVDGSASTFGTGTNVLSFRGGFGGMTGDANCGFFAGPYLAFSTLAGDGLLGRPMFPYVNVGGVGDSSSSGTACMNAGSPQRGADSQYAIGGSPQLSTPGAQCSQGDGSTIEHGGGGGGASWGPGGMGGQATNSIGTAGSNAVANSGGGGGGGASGHTAIGGTRGGDGGSGKIIVSW